jgi:archaemetzincin
MGSRPRAPIALAHLDTNAVPPWLPRLRAAVEEAFAWVTTVAPPLTLPAAAYRPAREQYLSTALLEQLVTAKLPHWHRLLGIVDVDLFVPGLNFVFGEADARHGVAVMSTWRLREADDPERFLRLVITEAVHEIGHTFGLGHCRDPECAMWFSNTLAESVHKGSRFCALHAAELAAAA